MAKKDSGAFKNYGKMMSSQRNKGQQGALMSKGAVPPAPNPLAQAAVNPLMTGIPRRRPVMPMMQPPASAMPAPGVATLPQASAARPQFTVQDVQNMPNDVFAALQQRLGAKGF